HDALPILPQAGRRRFALGDDDLAELGRQALAIEDHYQRPMDIEWVKGGVDGHIYIVQARPETVQSRSGRVLERFRVRTPGKIVVTGRAVGSRVASGRVRVVARASAMPRGQSGGVLGTDTTDPASEPAMTRAAALVTRPG